MLSIDRRPFESFVFDAYGTLFDVYGVTTLCEELFPGQGRALATLWRAKQLNYSLLRSLMEQYRDFWQLTQDALAYATASLNLELTRERRNCLMEAYLTLPSFPDARVSLEQLKARGMRLAILSNGAPTMLAAAVRRADLGHLLDAVLSVDDVRVFKPSPRVYALIQSRLGVLPASTAFVSANSWDINGAGAAGLTTCWIQRSAAEPADELGYPATYVVHSLTELTGLLGDQDLPPRRG
ncbi:MAG: haloacid dehalogenase type II [Vicinamibacterales bacterium]